MLKKRLAYVCDKCEKTEFPVFRTSYVLGTFAETMPDDWIAIGHFFRKKKHLCLKCAEEYRRFKRFLEKQKEEEVNNGDFGLG